MQSNLTARESRQLSMAGVSAEEALSGIRTVKAFSAEESEINRYKHLLNKTLWTASKRGLYSGLAEGIMRFLYFSLNALTFWYGIGLVLDSRALDQKDYTAGTLLIVSDTMTDLFVGNLKHLVCFIFRKVVLGMITAADNISKILPYMETFSVAQGTAASIFRIINRHSQLDSLSMTGIVLPTMKGDIEFEKVRFHYPSRPDVPVMITNIMFAKYKM